MAVLWALCLVLCALPGALLTNLISETCDVNANTAIIEPTAQAMIVGLFEMRVPNINGTGCGQPDMVTMPAYEAVKWALNLINTDNGQVGGITVTDSYVPGIKIGMKVYDTCGNAQVATEKVIAAFQKYYVPSKFCTAGTTLNLGIIGATRSVVNENIAKWLGEFKGVQVSFASSTTSLGDKSQYPYFMRTTPPQSVKAQIIVEVLMKIGWTKISVVYGDDAATLEDYTEVLHAASKAGICITQAQPTNRDLTSNQLAKILTKLTQSDTDGVVYVGAREEALQLIATIPTVQGSDSLQWLFTGSVSPDDDFVRIYSTRLRGFLAVSPESRLTTEFRDYWINLNELSSIPNNPWYQDWYMTVNDCKLPAVNYEPYASKTSCLIRTPAQKLATYVQNQYVASAIDAVFTFAQGLKAAQAAKCAGTRGVCDNLKSMTSVDFFSNYLLKVDLTYSSSERIPSWTLGTPKRLKFDPSGELWNSSHDIFNYNNRQVTFNVARVGYYSNRQLSLDPANIVMYDSSRINALATLPKYACSPSGCGICLQTKDANVYLQIPGDILINAIMSVHTDGTGRCAVISSAAAQRVQAFIYAIATVKSNLNILQNINIGTIGFDDCGVPTSAANFIEQFDSVLLNINSAAGDPYTSQDAPIYVAATQEDVTIEVAQLLTRMKIPQISYRATNSELSDFQQFPYFMRTVPSDAKLANAIVQILRNMKWSYVQVVNSPDIHGRSSRQSFIQQAAAYGICVTAAYELNTDGAAADILNKLKARSDAKVIAVFANAEQHTALLSSIKASNDAGNLLLIGDYNWGSSASITAGLADVAKGSITVDFKSFSVSGFRTYLSALNATYSTNPWFRQWYQNAFSCYLDATSMVMYTQPCDPTKSITDAPGFTEDPMNLETINAVYVSAMGIHKVLEQVCGVGYTSVCDAFKQHPDRANLIVTAMQNATFSDLSSTQFKLTGREWAVDFDVYNYIATGAKKIGTVNSLTGNLVLTGTVEYYATPIASVCNSANNLCDICLQSINKALFMPGDVYVAGLFGIHQTGASAYTCGDIKITNGYQNSEAFAYAIDQVNSGRAPVRLNGVKLGGLGFDDCSSEFRATNLVSTIHNGSVVVGKDGQIARAEMIKVWLSYRSANTIAVSDELRKRNIPLISPSASTTALSDSVKYPDFFRTVPDDNVLTQSIVRFVLSLNWGCVQVVYAPNIYGRTGYQIFRQNAKIAKLCVTQCMELETAGSYDVVMKRLIDAPSQLVVIIADEGYITQLLAAKERANATGSGIAFIGATSWGSSKAVIAGHDLAARMSLSFKVDSPLIQNFTDYLTVLFPGQYVRNPWFDEYYQKVFACDLPAQNKYGKQCVNPQTTSLVSFPGFEQENWVVTTMDAVYATAQAIDMTLRDVCGINYNGLCPSFSANGVSDRIMINLDKVNFLSARNKIFQFNSRTGVVGFDIFQYTASNSYLKVGTTMGLSPSLTNQTTLIQQYISTVSLCAPCQECPFDVDISTDEQFLYVPGDILLGGIFDVSRSGLFPFSCAGIRPQYSLQLVEAFVFALQQVNSKQGIFGDTLRGITLGGVALDSCESAVRAGNLLSDFHTDQLRLYSNGEKVDSNKVKAYIGGFDSSRSMQMASVLRILGLPQISYGATGLALSDKTMYPFFSRTVPNIVDLVKGIIEFLKYFNINSVQIVNSPGTYGEDTTSEFMTAAVNAKICVAQNITFKDNGTVTTQSAFEVVNLLLNRPNTTVVITFLETAYINVFLNMVKLNKMATGKFRFIGSTDWGNNDRVYLGAETEIQKAVTFNIETGNVPGFDAYLSTKLPNTYSTNPWFSAYYQEIYQCTLPGSQLTYSKPCTIVDQSLVNSQYNQESFVLYVVDAVYAAAFGLHKTLLDICGQNYTGMCDNWRTSMDPSTQLLNAIRATQFPDAAIASNFKFINNGESIRGYEVYSLEKYSAPGSVLSYNLIGKYTHVNDTTMTMNIAPSYKFNYASNCTPDDACAMCPYMSEKLSRYMKITAPNGININIVALLGVHNSAKNYLDCDDLDTTGGFLKAMAFFYGLNLVNLNLYNDFPFSLKIGGLVIDTCASVNKMQAELYSFVKGDGLCMDASKDELFDPNTVVAYITLDSWSSLNASKLLTPRMLTSVSPLMIDPVDTKVASPFLLRTLPNCGKQGSALFDILQQYNWSLFGVVYSNDDCDVAALQSLIDRAQNRGFCLAKSTMLTIDATLDTAKAIIQLFNANQQVKTIVLLTNSDHTRLLLTAIWELNLKGRFVLLGLDSWGTNTSIVNGLEDIAAGSITIKLPQPKLSGFKTWMAGMTNNARLGVPEDWFHEFWQRIHNCSIPTAKVVVSEYGRLCTMSEVITEDMIGDDSEMLSPIVAAYVIARGLVLVQNNATCVGMDVEICFSTLPNIKRQLIFDAIKAVMLRFPPGQLQNQSSDYGFDAGNDGITNYVIYNYVNFGGGLYQYKQVGMCRGQCMASNIVTYNADGSPSSIIPKSSCPQDGTTCVCETTIAPVFIRPAPAVGDMYGQPFGIVITILNIIGVLTSFFLFFYFLCFYPIRGGTTVLGYVALFGIFLLFAFNFSYIFHPHVAVCGVRRFCQGVIYAIIFGAFAVKSMCTWKNTNVDDDFAVSSTKRFTHPFGLFVITMCFAMVQVIIDIEWLILEPPAAVQIVLNGQYWPRCHPHEFYNQGLVLSLIYVMFLMFLTLGFSGFSWPNHENNFEARYILGSTVFCMGTWMVWCIVSTMTDLTYRDGSTAVGNLFCGYGILIFIFFRKCFLLHQFKRNKPPLKTQEQKDNLYGNIAASKEADVDRQSDKASGRGSL